MVAVCAPMCVASVGDVESPRENERHNIESGFQLGAPHEPLLSACYARLRPTLAGKGGMARVHMRLGGAMAFQRLRDSVPRGHLAGLLCFWR